MPSSTRAAQNKRSEVKQVVNFSRLSQKEAAAEARLARRLQMKDIDDVSSTSSEMGMVITKDRDHLDYRK